MFDLNQQLQRLRTLIGNQCLLCHGSVAGSLPLCRPCQTDLPWLGNHCQHCALPLNSALLNTTCGECLHNPPPWQQCIAAFEYHSPIKQLISRYKHNGNLAAGRLLATLLAKAIELNRTSPQPQVLLPVPLHWRRQLHRGFNQSHDLARLLSAQLGIPARHQHLRKLHHTASQHDLPRKQRQQNLRGQFEVNKAVEGLHIALVDDVMTTGSTARAIAAILTAAGARRVDIWCIARTPAANVGRD